MLVVVCLVEISLANMTFPSTSFDNFISAMFMAAHAGGNSKNDDEAANEGANNKSDDKAANAGFNNKNDDNTAYIDSDETSSSSDADDDSDDMDYEVEQSYSSKGGKRSSSSKGYSSRGI